MLVWRGGKTDLATKCIQSWKKFCPDYKIIEWNESNFDIDKSNFTKLAYQEKKYSFVSDYARLEIIYNNGGIYLDTDVEIIKNIDELLENKAFMGTENFGSLINPGSGFGAVKNSKIILDFLNFYKTRSFENEDGVLDVTPITCLLTPIIKNKGWKDDNTKQIIDDLTIYPADFFCPKDYDGILKITNNTFSIHHFEGSWIDDKMKRTNKLQEKILKIFGTKISLIVIYIYKIIKRKGLLFFFKRFPLIIKKYFKKFKTF